MARWREVVEAEPDFATAVQKRFDAYKHKVIATLRADGSPRISGIEAEFRDGEVSLGMMPGSLKARDVLRDPRLALHCGTEDPADSPAPGTVFDAKLAGRAVPVEDEDFHQFTIDVSEVVLISLGDPGDHLLIETWHEGKPLRSVKRH